MRRERLAPTTQWRQRVFDRVRRDYTYGDEVGRLLLAIAMCLGGCDKDCSIEARVALLEPVAILDCGVYPTYPGDEGMRYAMRLCVLDAIARQAPFMAIWETQGIEYPIRRGLAGGFVEGTWTTRYYSWTGGTISGDGRDATTAWECTSVTDVGWCAANELGHPLCLECVRGPEVDRCSDE